MTTGCLTFRRDFLKTSALGGAAVAALAISMFTALVPRANQRTVSAPKKSGNVYDLDLGCL